MGLKVIIIGGGLSGSLLANGLLNNETDTTVYERDPEDVVREGYQIRLGSSAMAGFRACLKDADIAKIERKFGQSSGGSSTAPIIYSSRFKTILDLTTLPTYTKSYAINRVILRNLLLEPVKEAGKVRFGKAFSHYEIVSLPSGGDKVRVYFEDGSEDIGDILVGADGSRSKINHQVGARNLVPLPEWKAFLSKGGVPSDRIREYPQQLLKSPLMTLTKDATLFYALYLPAREKPTVDLKDGLDYETEGASFYWGLTLHRKFLEGRDIETSSKSRQICLDYVAKHWAPEFKNLLLIGAKDAESSEIYTAPLRASNKLSKSWRADVQKQASEKSSQGHPQVWLLGDAVHAMLPNRGMGGNQALHDCADLLPQLLELDRLAKSGAGLSKQQLQQACKLYEDAMIDRAFTWVQKSGGTTIGNIDFDGVLGTLVLLVGRIIVPIATLFYRVFNIGG